jgi:hypothetical protein
MTLFLSDAEIRTLADIADPHACLIHDGAAIASLSGKLLIEFEGGCYRLTEIGRDRLRRAQSQETAACV